MVRFSLLSATIVGWRMLFQLTPAIHACTTRMHMRFVYIKAKTSPRFILSSPVRNRQAQLQHNPGYDSSDRPTCLGVPVKYDFIPGIRHQVLSKSRSTGLGCGAHRLTGHLLLYSPCDRGFFPGELLAISRSGDLFLFHHGRSASGIPVGSRESKQQVFRSEL